MKILFVCFSYSIHAVRWIDMARRKDWDIHVFPSQEFDALHESFHDLTYWPAQPKTFQPQASIRVEWNSAALQRRADGELDFTEYLARLLHEGDFDIVHSLEMQHAAYLTFDALRFPPFPRPRWIVTNYGSDIFLFGRDPQHRDRIMGVLENCDYYSAECHRDVRLAIEFGFKGRIFEVCPNGGGIDLAADVVPRSLVPPSRRRVIAVKGYEHFAGRALTVLRVLERLEARLRGFRIVVHSPSPAVREEAEAMARRTGLEIDCLPDRVNHAEIMALHASARISIANSLSDGICTALLEAMAMGAFPIQSCTACADEWIVPGQTGFAPDPGDEAGISQAIEQALQDDRLVDEAAVANAETIRKRADRDVLRSRIDLAYSKVLAEMKALRDELAPPMPKQLPLPKRPYDPARRPAASDRPVLTVITPSYNRADFLAETIESVLSQDFEDFEYLIIDDGSKDNTAEVVGRYDDPRIKYLYHPNMGETRTVNRALKMVRGEFFTIINSDDPAVADSFSVLLEHLRRFDDSLLAYPDWFLIDETSAVKSVVRMPAFDIELMLSHGTLPMGPGAMFRSIVTETVGLRDPLLRYCADLDYIFRVAIAGRIEHVPLLLGTHRVHPGSASMSDHGVRLAREAAYPTQVYALHPLLTGLASRRQREGSAVGYFAASFVTPDLRFALQLLARAFLSQPVLGLHLVMQYGIAGLIQRLESLGAARGAARPTGLDAALAASSRQAAVRPLLRAFLTDPISVLDTALNVGHVELDRRIRSMPRYG